MIRLDRCIFLSYRRADSQADANALYQSLRVRFGRERIFKDVDDIAFGADFVEAIKSAVDKSSVLLVLMGGDWVGGSRDQSRLSDSADMVRLELEMAKSADLLIIPVLLEDTAMPHIDTLPPSLSWLIRLNAARLRRDSWDRDLAPLLDFLEERLNERDTPVPEQGASGPSDNSAPTQEKPDFKIKLTRQGFLYGRDLEIRKPGVLRSHVLTIKDHTKVLLDGAEIMSLEGEVFDVSLSANWFSGVTLITVFDETHRLTVRLLEGFAFSRMHRLQVSIDGKLLYEEHR